MDSSLVSLHLIDLNIIFGVTVLSQRHFPKGHFPSGNFPNVQFPKRNFPKVRLGHLRRCRLKWGPSAATRTDLGSCHLENSTFGKLSLGKNPLGKYLSNFVSKKVMNSVDF